MQVRVVAMEQGTFTIKCTTAAASWLKDYMQNAHTDGPDSEDELTAGMRKEFFDAMAEVLGPSQHNDTTPDTSFFEDTPYQGSTMTTPQPPSWRDKLTDHDWLQIKMAAAGTVSGTSDEWPDLVAAINKVRGGSLRRKPAAWLRGFCEALVRAAPDT